MKLIPHIYLGERLDLFGIRHAFRGPDGKEKFFKGKIHGLIRGECYGISPKGEILKRPAQIVDCKLRMTDKEETEFELHKELCKHWRAKKKKALNLKKPHPDISKAIELLRPFVRYSDNIELNRFVEYLENQLSKKKRK